MPTPTVMSGASAHSWVSTHLQGVSVAASIIYNMHIQICIIYIPIHAGQICELCWSAPWALTQGNIYDNYIPVIIIIILTACDHFLKHNYLHISSWSACWRIEHYIRSCGVARLVNMESLEEVQSEAQISKHYICKQSEYLTDIVLALLKCINFKAAILNRWGRREVHVEKIQPRV